jgi:hypothetical protein
VSSFTRRSQQIMRLLCGYGTTGPSNQYFSFTGYPKNALCEEIDGRAMLCGAVVRHRGVGGDGVTRIEPGPTDISAS